MLFMIFIIGALALLFIGGLIFAIVRGAPFIGFILLCLLIGGVVILMLII